MPFTVKLNGRLYRITQLIGNHVYHIEIQNNSGTWRKVGRNWYDLTTLKKMLRSSKYVVTADDGRDLVILPDSYSASRWVKAYGLGHCRIGRAFFNGERSYDD